MYQGLGPYGSPKEEISITDLKNWYPKFRFQQETIDTICMSGPATAKATYQKSIEAHCYYNFKFKWGGCPAPMQDIYDPCSQSKFPVPNNLLQGLQTQNPNTPPETELHDFDERHETITTRAIQRIQEYTATKTPCISITDSNFDPPTKTQRQLLQEAFQETSDEEEAQTSLQQQLQQTATTTTTTQAAHQATPQQTQTFRIIEYVQLFPTQKPNRRLNVYELEDEICTARAFKRPVKQFIYDQPYYPYFPPAPKPISKKNTIQTTTL